MKYYMIEYEDEQYPIIEKYTSESFQHESVIVFNPDVGDRGINPSYTRGYLGDYVMPYAIDLLNKHSEYISVDDSAITEISFEQYQKMLPGVKFGDSTVIFKLLSL